MDPTLPSSLSCYGPLTAATSALITISCWLMLFIYLSLYGTRSQVWLLTYRHTYCTLMKS